MQGCDLETGAEIDQAVMAALIEETGPEIVAELIDMFLDETAARRQRMRERLADGDLQRLAREAHALVSSAAQFGGHAASDAALRLERIARTGAAADAAWQELEQMLATLIPALIAFRDRLTA